LDISDLNVDVNQIGPQQAHEINQCGTGFGLVGNDFYSLLTRDLEEQEALRLAREHEEEKAMYSVS
jgi:arginine/serine-rich splicing factor 16